MSISDTSDGVNAFCGKKYIVNVLFGDRVTPLPILFCIEKRKMKKILYIEKSMGSAVIAVTRVA